MSCVSYCFLGAALLGSSILTMLTSKQAGVFKRFNNMLSEDQQQIYKSIINVLSTTIFSINIIKKKIYLKLSTQKKGTNNSNNIIYIVK